MRSGETFALPTLRSAANTRLLMDAPLRTTLPEADGTLQAVPWGGFQGNDATENPDFHDANHVFGNYCSSDLWTGATAARRQFGWL